jgi:glycosyltransferase involved in cell wall biosynthesis
MTRIGINPARGKLSSYRPSRISVTILTYIPSLEGYFKNRLEVLKLVFASLDAHTSFPHDVLVFDNGSCQATIDFLLELRAQKKIDFLLLSRQNIGKIGALKLLFQAAPGEIIAYCDDDIFFYPGWLEASLTILDNFPLVGIVSGAPVRYASGYARASLDQLASEPPTGISVSRERCIPDSWEIDWALSTGRDPQGHLRATSAWPDLVFRLNTINGKSVEAIGCANHFQFIGRKELLLRVLPPEWSGQLMGAMVELDHSIDNLGYLRLSTKNRYTRHMGNQVNPDLREEAIRMGLNFTSENQERSDTLYDASRPGSTISVKIPSLQHKVSSRETKSHSGKKAPLLLRIPGSRRFLSWLYRSLFEILYVKDN